MYGMIKIHKENNPGRIIMTGSGAAVKNLSIFLKKVSQEVQRVDTRIQDTQHMLNTIDDLN